MICNKCSSGKHVVCANVTKLGTPLGTWCDCQHKLSPGQPRRGSAKEGRN